MIYDEEDNLTPHENHEMLRSGCPDCEAELNVGMAHYRLPPASQTYPEAEEGLAMRGRLPDQQ